MNVCVRVLVFVTSLVLPLAHVWAVSVSINTGQYVGEWDMDLDGNFQTGPQILDLAPGQHRFRAASAQVIFQVDAAGVVTLAPEYDGVSATGGANALNLLTRPLAVDPGDYAGNWEFTRIRSSAPGGDVVHLVPTEQTNPDGSIGGQYRLAIGIASSALFVNLRGDGSLSFSEGNATAAAVYEDQGTLRFANRSIQVSDRDASGIAWSINLVTPAVGSPNALVGDHVVDLVPGVQYSFRANGAGAFFTVADPCGADPAALSMNGLDFDMTCEGVVLDQVNDALPVNCSFTLGAGAPEPPTLAQTLTVGETGRLEALAFAAQRPGSYDAGDLTLELRNVEAQVISGQTVDVPGSTLIATKTIDDAALAAFPTDSAQFTTFDVSDLALDVTAGDRLAVVWTRQPYAGSGGSNLIFYCSGGTVGDPEGLYVGGRAFTSPDEQATWSPFNSWIDFRFRTYVNSFAANEPPSADAGVDQSIRAGDVVVLDGSGSFDDNTATADLSYSWTFSSLPAGSSAVITDANLQQASFTADLADEYVVGLIVVDEAGLVSVVDEVVIGAQNLAPTADAGADRLVLAADNVALHGSLSSDPEMDTLSYQWSLVALPAGSSATIAGEVNPLASLVTDLPGVYDVQLIVSDLLGPSAPDTVRVTALDAPGYAELKVMDAHRLVDGLANGQVTTSGNRNALTNFLMQAATALQEGDIELASDKMQKALQRVDGCTLRGSPDGNGKGRDWVVDCSAQMDIYDLLTDALAAF